MFLKVHLSKSIDNISITHVTRRLTILWRTELTFENMHKKKNYALESQEINTPYN